MGEGPPERRRDRKGESRKLYFTESRLKVKTVGIQKLLGGVTKED